MRAYVHRFHASPPCVYRAPTGRPIRMLRYGMRYPSGIAGCVVTDVLLSLQTVEELEGEVSRAWGLVLLAARKIMYVPTLGPCSDGACNV